MAQRHHYVPEFYQKGFTSEGRLWKYDRRFHSYNRCYPKENCFEWDLYAVRPGNGPEDRRIETDVLSRIDGAAATTIKNGSIAESMGRIGGSSGKFAGESAGVNPSASDGTSPLLKTKTKAF